MVSFLTLPYKSPAPKPRGRVSPASRLAAAALAALLALPAAPPPATAQQGGRLPLIRDAEIEQLVRDYAAPLLKAGGLNQGSVEIVLVNNRTYNAFVADGTRMFINTGVLVEAQTPNEVIGVLAHETGHIVGGHLARLRDAVARAQTIAVIGALLGIAGAVAGAASGSSSAAQGGFATAMASGSAAQRTLLAYQRTEELSADRAGLTLLEKTGQSGRGMLRTFRRFADQMLVSSRLADPYAQSHPMPRDRIAQLETLVEQSKFAAATDSPALQLRHDMMRAKLVAFLDGATGVARRWGAADQSMPARYARAILAYRFGNPVEAGRQIDALIAAEPGNPYFHELRGQALLESGRAREALAPLRRAVALAPGQPLIRVMLGQALVATNDKALLDEAIRELTVGIGRERLGAGGAYRQLAIAYGRKGDTGMADLMIAQGLFAEGAVAEARAMANRAQANLKQGSPGWLRADDIISYKPPQL